MVDPARVYQLLMDRLPQFVGQVINDAMLADRVAYHTALAEAAHQFARELCPERAPDGGWGTPRTLPLRADADVIAVGPHQFSRRHFAKNYDSHFRDVVATRFRDLHGIVVEGVEVTDDALALTLRAEKSQPASPAKTGSDGGGRD